MGKNIKSRRSFCQETGSVLVMVAFSMVVLLAASAIAIDLANLYMARAQAQRAADAAALAGAKEFVLSGCTTGGCTAGGVQETLAKATSRGCGGSELHCGTGCQHPERRYNL